MTPTLARMVAAKQNGLRKPVRWFTIPNIWRYEQPQRGRRREFYQWNVDILGVDSMDADAEIAAIVVDVMKSFGLSQGDFVIRISNRYYLEELLKSLGIDMILRDAIYREIDRIEKLKPEVFRSNLQQVGLDIATIEKLETTLRNRDFGDFKPLRDLWQRLNDYGIAEFAEFDPSIVRGLLYYTGTVFEVWDPSKKFNRAIMGGGRYDNLVTALGGQPLSAVGIAASDVTIEEMLEQHGKLPDLAHTLDAFVAHYSVAEKAAAIKVASQLREAGLDTELSMSEGSLDKQLKAAVNSGARFAVIVAPDELARGEVNVKNLQTREQRSIKLEELAEALK
jgi:histidyl-tRNA synthetase